MDDDFETRRQAMVERISAHFKDTRETTGIDAMSAPLRSALLDVPRHRFVPEPEVDLAYADSALPIGCGQTISQPFIVALMIDLARVGPHTRVLEVGTGSGYQAAVLAAISDQVFTVEVVPELAERSAASLRAAGFTSVQTRHGDGFDGWPEAAPFEAILVTACASEVPAPLIEQLAPGGRLVIPVGTQFAFQELQVLEKREDGEVVVRHGLPVAFVPFVHDDSRED